MAEKKLFCAFHTAGRLFGFDIRCVKEIITEFQITPVFHAPDGVLGYMNLRGQIHVILDLKQILGFSGAGTNAQGCIIIFKHSISEPFGVLVEKVEDIYEISGDLYEKDSVSGTPNALTCGYCKLSDGLMVILDPLLILNNLKT
ncbi:MAG: chemotaxis protein CheW [Candidatus Riflebacteria bacterium]|nr:chemotaxis protein CheW [Candidatus Riflebacteria bacterium]